MNGQDLHQMGAMHGSPRKQNSQSSIKHDDGRINMLSQEEKKNEVKRESDTGKGKNVKVSLDKKTSLFI